MRSRRPAGSRPGELRIFPRDRPSTGRLQITPHARGIPPQCRPGLDSGIAPRETRQPLGKQPNVQKRDQGEIAAIAITSLSPPLPPAPPQSPLAPPGSVWHRLRVFIPTGGMSSWPKQRPRRSHAQHGGLLGRGAARPRRTLCRRGREVLVLVPGLDLHGLLRSGCGRGAARWNHNGPHPLDSVSSFCRSDRFTGSNPTWRRRGKSPLRCRRSTASTKSLIRLT